MALSHQDLPCFRVIGNGEMANLIRKFDWGKTAVGSIGTWSDILVATVNLLVASRHAMFLWWGPDLIQFYNDGYQPSISAGKHPYALGQPGKECWPEIWPIIGPQIESVMDSGSSTWQTNQRVPIWRNGRLEEVFWTYSYNPVREKNGEIQGTLVVCDETTKQVLIERRLRTLLGIYDDSPVKKRLPETRALLPLAHAIVARLDEDCADFPFVNLYLLTRDEILHAGGASSTGLLAEPDHWPLREIRDSEVPLLVEDLQQRFGEIICEPWPEPVTRAYLLPLRMPGSPIQVVLVLGISPRLPFDESYRTFLHLVGSRTASLLQNEVHQLELAERTADLEQQAEVLAEQAALLDLAQDAIVVRDMENRILFWNHGAEALYGWLSKEALGRNSVDLLKSEYSEPAETIRAKLLDQGRWDGEAAYQKRDGRRLIVTSRSTLQRNADGKPARILTINTDITERKAAEEALRNSKAQIVHAAEHDFLTGLPNRMLLKDRIDQAIIMASRHRKKVALLFLDLDGFKHINDSLGHPVGDKLLMSIATRLVNCVRRSDTVSRQGGDEFIALLSEMENPEDAAILARRMLNAVAEFHSVDEHDLHITTSIGVSVYPEDGRDAETLIKNADTAMYQAKENGRQSYQFFESAMNVRAVERQSIEEGLRRALDRKEFALHYQPKIDLRTGEITGAEALLRWNHPQRGAVAPSKFVPIAEDCGLILPVGAWVLREACRQGQVWLGAGLPATTMAVNISAMEFRSEEFLAGLFGILKETGFNPAFLQIELTESVLMKHAESAESILGALRDRGVQVALDDFGTGYSSLSYLRKFPIDALKIDQSFVRQITTTPEETTIVTAIINMGRNLGLRVIAEGVETKEELAFLKAHECDEAQGYYFSRPVVADQFAGLLRNGLAVAASQY